MAVTITKVKKPSVKTAGKIQSKVSSDIADNIQLAAQLVDTICSSNPAILAAKEPAKEQLKARKELLDIVEGEYESNEVIIVTGLKGKVQFSAQASTLELIDVKKVHEMLGDEAFYAIAKVGVTDLKKYLTASQVDKVTKLVAGSRSMTVLPLG